MVSRIRLTVLLVALAAGSLSAHRLPPEVEVYFKVAGTALRVLVRLPLVTLADARLPLTSGGVLDLVAARPMIDAVAVDFARSAAVMDGDEALAAPSSSWRLAARDDVSFATYDSAAVHLSAPPLPPERLDLNTGFLDLRFDYVLVSAAPTLSARVNASRVNGAFIPTRATYLPADGDERRFVADGAPHRVSFEPSWPVTAGLFARLGLDRVAGERGLLLFLFCLVIPRRPSSETVRLVAATMGAYLAAGVVTAGLPSGPGTPLQYFCQVVASAALVAAAVLSVQSSPAPRVCWVRAVCVLFGVVSGVGIGVAARESLGFAGSHAVTGLALLLGTTALGVSAAVPVLAYVTRWFHRLPLPERAASIVLSLAPIHTALHQLATNGQTISGAGASEGGGLWTLALDYWPPLVAVVGLGLLAGVSMWPARAERIDRGGRAGAG